MEQGIQGLEIIGTSRLEDVRSERAQEPRFVAPRTPLEHQLAEIWEQVLNVRPVSVTDNFFELGGTSILAAHLFVEIERVFGKRLPLVTLLQAQTVEGLCGLIREGKTAEPLPSLVAIQSEGSKYPFFFVPGGHGHALGYAKLAPFLGPDQPFFAFEARGWDGIQTPHASVQAMAQDYVHELRSVQAHGPYMLGGLCMGGMVALEMAQQLRQQGEKVGLLVMMDLPRRFDFSTTYVKLQWAAVRMLDWPIARRIRYPLNRFLYHWNVIGQLTLSERTEYVLDKARKALGVVTGTSLRPRPRVSTEVADAYAQTIFKYEPRPYEDAVTLLASERSYKDNPTLGWGDLIRGELSVQVVPGDHTNYLSRHLSTTGRKLSECLEKAQANATSTGRQQVVADS